MTSMAGGVRRDGLRCGYYFAVPYRQEPQDQRSTSASNERDEDLEVAQFGGLLITGDLADFRLSRLSELQYAVRNLIVGSVAFAAIEPHLVDLPNGAIHIPSAGEAAVRDATDALVVSSSITVNPWQEVIAATSAGLGIAGVSAASVVKGLERVPRLLDLSIRLSTFRFERQVRKKELRNREAELDIEFYERLNKMASSVPPARSLANTIVALPDTGPVDFIDIRPISEQEVDERRRQMLRIVRDEEE